MQSKWHNIKNNEGSNMFYFNFSVNFYIIFWRKFMRTKNGVNITITAIVTRCQSMVSVVEFIANDTGNVNECIATKK